MKIALYSIATEQECCVGFSKATKSFAITLLVQVTQIIVITICNKLIAFYAVLSIQYRYIFFIKIIL